MHQILKKVQIISSVLEYFIFLITLFIVLITVQSDVRAEGVNGYRWDSNAWNGAGACDPWAWWACTYNTWRHTECPPPSLGYCGDTYKHDPSPNCKPAIDISIPELRRIFTAFCNYIPPRPPLYSVAPNYGYCMWPGPSVAPTVPGPTATAVPINNIPISSSAITNTTACVPSVQDWSGQMSSNVAGANILSINTPNLANNPLTVVTYHEDADGIGDIDRMGFWMSSYSPYGWNTKADKGASIRIKRTGPGSYQYLYYTNPENFTGAVIDVLANRAICTDTNTGAQASCTITSNGNVLNGNSNYGSWIMLISTEELSGTKVKLTWKVGFLDNAVNILDEESLKVYTVVADKKGAYSWDETNMRNWNVDLTKPSAALSISDQTPSGFTVNFNITETNSIVSSTTTGTATGVIADSTISILGSPAQTHTFTSTNQAIPRSPFFENVTSSTARSYSISEGSDFGSMQVKLNIKDQSCNVAEATTTINKVSGPWLMTLNGDTFSSGYKFSLGAGNPNTVTGNTNINQINNQSGFLSTYLALSKATSSSSPLSSKNYSNTSYTDLNFKARNSSSNSWLDYFGNTVKSKADAKSLFFEPLEPEDKTLTDNSASLVTAIIAGRATYNPANAYVVKLPNLIINSNTICNSKTIFLVSNLTINPDFIEDNNSSACMFVVTGATTITPGTDQATGPDVINYDQIHAFIVTSIINANVDGNGDGLFIKGGLIANADITSIPNSPGNIDTLDREFIGTKNVLAPSEAFYYDGTKYMYLFNDFLDYSNQQSIKEKQFISGSQN